MPNRCQNGNGWRFRYYQTGSLPVRTPVEFGPLAIGVPRCHRIDRCRAHAGYLARARHEPDISHGFRTFVPSNAPQSGNFGRSRRCHRIDRCRAHAGYLACGNPRPRKYPPKYPRRVRSKSLVISRVCEKYPQYPQYPRDVGDACLMRAFPCAQRCESQGASGDDLSPTARMAVFSRFGGGKDASTGFRSAGVETPQKGPFLGALVDAIESTGAAHTQGYLARGNPRSRKYPREYPRHRKYPPEYPHQGFAKRPVISRT